MENDELVLLIIAMALVTYIPRLMPALFFSRTRIPPVIRAWLLYVPSSIVGAMLFPSLLVVNGNLHLDVSNIALLAAIPTALVAYVTRSLVATVVAGVAIASLAKGLT